MGNAAATALISTLDDDAWEDLLSFIEERRVIPIVGPELLLVATERGPLDDGGSSGGVDALKAAIEAAIALILEEHQDWHLLVRPHNLPLA